MKRLFLVLVGVFIVSIFACATSWASPFVVCDPYTTNPPDYFKVTLDAGTTQQVTIYGTPPYLHFDVASVAVGSHTIKAKACDAATLWNPEVCSAETTFTFTRPSAPVTPAAPSNIGLVP